MPANPTPNGPARTQSQRPERRRALRQISRAGICRPGRVLGMETNARRVPRRMFTASGSILDLMRKSIGS